MKRTLLLLIPLMLMLSACTDIRTRLSPDLLAADAGTVWHFAAHTSQNDRIITADTPVPLLFPDALQNAAGADISAGHLSVLAVSGNPCTFLTDALQSGLLAPTCAVLSVPERACSMLQNGTLPDAAVLRTAAETGQLPLRTADTVTGDLWSTAGITAIPYTDGSCLTLMLWDAERSYGCLSESACRGLALLGRHRRQFAFAAGETACSVTQTRLRLSAAETGRQLHITVSGTVHISPACPEAKAVLRNMLLSALEETAGRCGADLLFLHETALRCGIPQNKISSRTEWQEMLKNAAFSVHISALPQAACAS